MALKTGSKTKSGAKAKKPGPKNGGRKRGIGTANPPPVTLASAFQGPSTSAQLPKINHLPQQVPPLGQIIQERFGRLPAVKDAPELMMYAQEYFEWCERNPMWEDKLVTFQGFASHEPVPKMRLRSIGTLCFFLGINQSTWYLWRQNRDDLRETMLQIEDRIKEENKAGASAELMNANFVARVMGLADRQEHTGKDGGPLTTAHVDVDLSKLSDEELAAYQTAAKALERIRSEKG